jgi:hypothetical protein
MFFFPYLSTIKAAINKKNRIDSNEVVTKCTALAQKKITEWPSDN